MLEGWDTLSEAVAAACADVATSAPDGVTAAEGQAYVMRVLTSCLTDAFLGHITVEGGLTRALPTRGGPNPDYRMSFARLDPARRYRLEGQLNGSERVGVGTYAVGDGGTAELAAYAAIDAKMVDAEGRFALDLAAGIEGAGTLPIASDARALTIRVLHRDTGAAPAHMMLHGVPAMRDLALAEGSVTGALGHVARALRGSIATFLEWSTVTSAARNSFHAVTPAMKQGVQGDPDTTYYLGSFDLEDDEWLEVTIRTTIAGYWSLHAYNHWCEVLPGAGIGDDMAVSDADGQIHIAIGSAVPDGTANRIDTLGRRRGALIFRCIGAAQVDVPRTRTRPVQAR